MSKLILGVDLAVLEHIPAVGEIDIDHNRVVSFGHYEHVAEKTVIEYIRQWHRIHPYTAIYVAVHSKADLAFIDDMLVLGLPVKKVWISKYMENKILTDYQQALDQGILTKNSLEISEERFVLALAWYGFRRGL